MSEQQKKAAVMVAVAIGGFITLLCGAVWLGLGEYAAMAIYAGLALGGLTLIGLGAEQFLPEEIGPQVRQFCLQGGAFSVLAICVLSRMYPSSFTPDFMAPTITASELGDRADDLVGHKRRVEGHVGYVTVDSADPWDDYVVLSLQLTDDGGDTYVYCRHPRDAALPTTGSRVALIGEVDPHFNINGNYLVGNGLEVLEPATLIATAEGH